MCKAHAIKTQAHNVLLARPVALMVNSMVCAGAPEVSAMFARVWTLKDPRQSRGTYCHGDSNMTTQAIRGLDDANRISALSRRGFFLTAAAVGGVALTPDAAR